MAGGTRSQWWYLSVIGAAVAGVSALAGTSMLSVGHLAGTVLLAMGLAGLASTGRIAQAVWLPNRRAFALLFAWVAVGYGIQVWAYYYSGGFLLLDLGLYADMLSNAARHGRYYSEPMQIHGLANHFNPVLLLLFVPLFAIAPNFLWLVAAKFLCFLIAALLLFQVSRLVLGPRSSLLWVLPCLWLVHTPLAYGFLFQFQAVHLAPPLIFASVIAALTGRRLFLVLCLLVLAGLKENLPLVAVSVGTFLVVEQRRWTLGTVLVCAGIAVGLTIFFVIMPWVAGTDVPPKLSRFGPLEYLQLKALVVCVLVLSMGALPLLHPRSLLWVLPVFGLQFATGHLKMLSFRYHYNILPLTVLFVASAYGLRAMEQREPVWRALGPRGRQWAVAAMVVMLVGLNGMLPLYSARLFWPTESTRGTITEVRAFRGQLPQDRELYATADLATYVVPQPKLRDLLATGRYWLTPRGPHAALISREPTKGIGRDLHAKVRAELESRRAQGCYTLEPLGQHLLLYLSVPEMPVGCPGSPPAT